MTDIVLPAVSPTMEKGTLARWLVGVGARVARGQIIAEIETDKASVEIASELDGTIGEIVVAAGTPDVPVGTVIARLGSVAPGAEHAHPAVPPPPPSRPIPSTHVAQSPAAAVSAPRAEDVVRVPAVSHVAQTGEGAEPLASPLSRRLARQLGIDLRSVRGTGERGRITKQDLEALDARLRSSRAVPVSTPPAAGEVVYPPAHGVPHEVVPLTAMRKTIARRLGESKRTVPHFYMTVDVEADALTTLRAQCNARPGAIKLSLNDFVVRAVALALVKVPAANVQYAGDVIYRYQRVDISIAVAVPEGLYTPVLRDAANKGVQTIAEETKALIDKARAGKLHPMDFEGGTFSISNLGMHGIKQFEAVINPPQAAILAVGASEKRVLPADDGGVRIGSIMTLSLSCDHRVIDGAVGAELLTEIKRRIEDPLGLLLG